ncbi:MAG: sigma-70 family RNA polymerase sigma factor [Oscillospiraceae bacterium]|nr:sigma-70 family RNA polymerase sigma factor [Oscillospiraceae bacterium]
MNGEEIATFAKAAAQGDSDAFEKLYLHTRDAAYFVALRITKNEDDALDMVQEAYLKAWQGIGKLEKPESFASWFKQITANEARMFLRKRKPLLFTEEDDVFDLEPEQDAEYIPGKEMDTAETRKLILDIVDGLPEDQRLCVLLHYFENMPVADTADSLGISANTVKSRMYYARGKIETSVRGLEKEQGLRLYSVAPIPLVVWALRSLSAGSAAHLSATILGGAAAGGTAATAAGGAAAKAGTAVGMKIVAGIAAGAIAVGASVAGVALLRRPRPEPPT